MTKYSVGPMPVMSRGPRLARLCSGAPLRRLGRALGACCMAASLIPACAQASDIMPKEEPQTGPAGVLQSVGEHDPMMRTPQTMTLLPDGRILALAEWANQGSVWDPRQRQWKPLAQGDTCHAGVFTTKLLSDGKVMVVGTTPTSYGCDDLAIMFWNGATESWSRGPALLEMRAAPVVTELADHRVLIMGGYVPGADNRLERLASVELYDGKTEISVGPLKTARSQFTGTLLADGRVMVVGGVDAHGNATNSMEIWDPKTQAWADGAPLPTARFGHAAVRLYDGRVMVMGGVNDTGQATADVELWDPTTAKWSAGTPMLFPAPGVSAALLRGGDVLAMSDSVYVYGKTPRRTPFAMLWESETGQWRPAGELAANPSGFKVNALDDGSALILAQWGRQPILRWTRIRAASSPRPLFGGRNAVSARLPDGRLLLAGGTDVAHGAGNYFVPADPPPPTGTYHASSGYGDVAKPAPHGLAARFVLTDTAEIFDPRSGRFSLTGRLHQPRMGHSMLVLADGRVLVAGGGAASYEHPDLPVDADSEVWDGKTGRWQVLGDDIRFRHGQRVSVRQLDDGSVLFFSMEDDDGAGRPAYEARVWHPDSGQVAIVAVAPKAAANSDVGVLRDGRVLIVNGHDATFDIWNSRTGGNRHGRQQALARGRWGVQPLHNGKVLLVETLPDTEGAHQGDPQQHGPDEVDGAATPMRSNTLLWDIDHDSWKRLGDLPAVFTNSAHLAESADGAVYAETAAGMFRLAQGGTAWDEDADYPFRPEASTVLAPFALVEEVYRFFYWNPQDGKWTTFPQNSYFPRSNPALAELADGRVMVAGGGRQKRVQLWDPRDGSWKEAAALRYGYEHPHAMRLPSGHVLLVGTAQVVAAEGKTSKQVICESWVPARDTWMPCGSFDGGDFTLGVIEQNRPLLLYGTGNASLYDEQENAWRAVTTEIRYTAKHMTREAYEAWFKAGGKEGDGVSLPLQSWLQLLDDTTVSVASGEKQVNITSLAGEQKARMRGLAQPHYLARLEDRCTLSWVPYWVPYPVIIRPYAAQGNQKIFGPYLPLTDTSMLALSSGTVVAAGIPGAGMAGRNPGFEQFEASCFQVSYASDDYPGMPGEPFPQYQAARFAATPAALTPEVSRWEALLAVVDELKWTIFQILCLGLLMFALRMAYLNAKRNYPL